jgi:BirA family biotin operon repressor/biotin-[acetyl-CoA-carboxylase] ligase
MWKGPWEVQWLDEVDSTNTYLRERARQGAPDGLVVVADHQTAGRGRLDRRWESPPGANLLASLLLRPACSSREVYLCTAAVALAAADACEAVAGVEVGLKWPNDLVVDGAKLAGILAEAEFSDGALSAVVVGIGLNVAWPGPDGAGGTSLADLRVAAPVDRHLLLGSLLGALVARRVQLDDPAGRRCLAEEVRRRSATLGQEVRVTSEGEVLTGRAITLDDQGRLVVETSEGARTFSAGDVTQLRPAPGARTGRG